MPETFFSVAPAAALFVVAPVFTRSKPAFSLSPLSPVGQAASVTLPDGQPIPLTHRDAITSRSPGSKLNGLTSLKVWAAAAKAKDVRSIANRIGAFIGPPGC